MHAFRLPWIPPGEQKLLEEKEPIFASFCGWRLGAQQVFDQH